ncbi:formate-tetrahydrofolate ligase [Paratrimastix pyriformis]|uniref:formate--tetrahydrofolate ligase n=1 Tax=Paratrimastix pyriformis TaxID=342808 RepID=A0ABQ8ULD5_9EUKA|nr:formate-tetrahydrofolate ligase [Paratrimastix pyriformis]
MLQFWHLARSASTQPPDVVISQSAKLLPIQTVAKNIGLLDEEILPHGSTVAKVKLDVLKRLADRPNGNYVDVTAISPTPLGEGKTTTTIGLSQALGAHLKKKVMTVIRQPSQGPTFGIKGGAAGGGYSQIVPMEDINIHLTGDFHAVTAANNLLAAAIDARMIHEAGATDEQLFNRLVPEGRPFTLPMLRRLGQLGLAGRTRDQLSPAERARYARLDIDPASVTWTRVMDTSDRFLRDIEIGRDPEARAKGCARQTAFQITTASECMAILALATSLADLRERLGRIVVGVSRSGRMVTADDLGVAGAMAVLMKESARTATMHPHAPPGTAMHRHAPPCTAPACCSRVVERFHDHQGPGGRLGGRRSTIMPNLMQTLEGTPAMVHAGPFANIAHGNSSVVGDLVGLKLVGRDGYLVTESGFGADCGMEKFFDIKCRMSGLRPQAVVLVATVRGLKHQGGGPPVVAGQRLPKAYTSEDLGLLRRGLCNLERHVRNATLFGVPTLVAINYFPTDTPAEIELVRKAALAAGATDAVVGRHFSQGGAGAVELAEATVAACRRPSRFEYLYPLEMGIKEKIHTIATRIYGARDVKFAPAAERKVALYDRLGLAGLPVCMAKTQYSFSHDPALKGAPSGYTLPVRDLTAAVGAGFLIPVLGAMQTMPGLPTRPAFYNIDLDPATGRVVGLN